MSGLTKVDLNYTRAECSAGQLQEAYLLENDIFSTWIFQEIDKPETIKNARECMRKYRSLQAKTVLRADPQRSSLYINGHIRGNGGHSDKVSKAVLKRDKAVQEIKEIDEALLTVEEECLQALKLKYVNFKYEGVSEKEMAAALHVSLKDFRSYLKRGLLQFAEAYKAGELQIFKE